MQLRNIIVCAISVLALGGCSSDSAPIDDNQDPPTKSLSCGASQLHAVVHDQCGAMDVQGEGECFCTSMGWAWNGSTCVQMDAGYCKCVGEDCDKLAKTEGECLASHGGCG